MLPAVDLIVKFLTIMCCYIIYKGRKYFSVNSVKCVKIVLTRIKGYDNIMVQDELQIINIKEIPMRKVKMFYSDNEYENWTAKFDNTSEYYDVPVLIVETERISADAFFQCKSWKTALRRFKKVFDNTALHQWVDVMYDSCESGYFKDGFTGDKKHYYSWGVEQYDDEWYVFLNVGGVYSL